MNICDGIVEDVRPGEIQITSTMHNALLAQCAPRKETRKDRETAQGPGTRFRGAVYKAVPSFETATHTRLDSEGGGTPSAAISV